MGGSKVISTMHKDIPSQNWYAPFLPTRGFTPVESARFAVILALRSIFFGLVIFICDQFLPLGTAPLALWIGSVLGVMVASCGARSSMKHAGFFLLLGTIASLHAITTGLLNSFASNLGGGFYSYAMTLHFGLVAVVFFVAAAATWGFWRIRHTTSLEAVLIAVGAVSLLSGHRDYHFDTPQITSDIAWALRIEPLSVLVIGGILTLVLLMTYLYVAVLPGQPLITSATAQKQSLHSFRPNYRDALIFSAVVIGLIGFVSRELYLYYHQIAETRIQNGVGEENTEGLSPLTFHSALGSTNQPSALVRLEGDYKQNPNTPMLYMRTNALSQMKGNQLVIAAHHLDRDVGNTAPQESFNGSEDRSLPDRTSVTQSIYLLAEHNTVFAVDFPISIRPLKNPNPGRFRGAYRAVSLAPAYSLEDLKDAKVGDPRWSPDERQHYLEGHADPRYAALAQKVSSQSSDPISKIKLLTQYLSKTAIYTLNPGHEVKGDEDPVAPFLFGDHRGYCVHFAHSLVFMFRALGIPSRIGTGYLTDLSESKDGHILLRMSDRHAWSEVYIEGKGWVPFDIQPEQVESHAGSDVDMKLLEELMGILGPGEEILPESVISDELKVIPAGHFITSRALRASLAVLFLIFCACKAFLRWGWALPGSADYKLKWAYKSVVAALLDVGFARRWGETKTEFRRRLLCEKGLNTLSLAELMNQCAYSQNPWHEIDIEEIKARRSRDLKALQTVPIWKRICALLNPRSLLSTVGGAL